MAVHWSGQHGQKVANSFACRCWSPLSWRGDCSVFVTLLYSLYCIHFTSRLTSLFFFSVVRNTTSCSSSKTVSKASRANSMRTTTTWVRLTLHWPLWNQATSSIRRITLFSSSTISFTMTTRVGSTRSSTPTTVTLRLAEWNLRCHISICMAIVIVAKQASLKSSFVIVFFLIIFFQKWFSLYNICISFK